jgi:spore coat polysaccharide biosynthesis predicted glycosyltransferase SpsG/L-amino acid N-acyltransferase YncA
MAAELKTVAESKLVIFENQSGANKHASVVVNAALGNCLKNCQYLNTDTNTRFFCGPRYWILRQEFHDYKQKNKTAGKMVRRITLIFGASDPSNLSSRILNELLKLERNFEIDLCLGVHFNYFKELNQVLAEYPGKQDCISLHINEKNMAGMMYRADLVITSPGTSAFEALSVGTPIIAITRNSRPDHAFTSCVETLDEDHLIELKDLLDQNKFIYPSQKEIIEAEIGEGKEEVLRTIKDLLGKIEIIDIKSKEATPEMIRQYIELRNANRHLINSKEVCWDETLKWLAETEADVYGLVQNGILIGVTITNPTRNYENTVFVRKTGEGTGPTMMRIAESKARMKGIKRIWAWTFRDNVISVKNLENSGWEQIPTDDPVKVYFEKILD